MTSGLPDCIYCISPWPCVTNIGYVNINGIMEWINFELPLVLVLTLYSNVVVGSSATVIVSEDGFEGRL